MTIPFDLEFLKSVNQEVLRKLIDFAALPKEFFHRESG
jgi:hypothetical protein